ncbi:MAG: ATP-binding protein [Clostridiales bacterium]|nr:ATP-binding protein [Clostridiales bacterium]
MKKAIYTRLMVLSCAAVLICSLVAAMLYAVYTENLTKEWLTKLTLSVAENYSYDSDVLSVSKAAGNNRITIIAPDGTVLVDSQSDAAAMENHAEREEVKYAKEGSVAIAMRTSSTLGEKFMYAAIKTEGGNILRLAHSYSGVLSNLGVQLPAILIAIVVALVLSLILAGKFSKAVTRPFENMVDALSAHEYEKLRHGSSPYYEIDKIMQGLQELLRKITESNVKLQEEREKVDYILSNMSEGFVLIDSKKDVLLCNRSAKEFFSCDSDGKPENIYHLTRSQTVCRAIQSAIESQQSSAFDLELAERRIVNIYVSPAETTEQAFGAAILLVDMTAEKRLEQQKRDFFSNASHELKTPVTSILGFSEMLNRGLVTSESEKAVVMGRIETETKRLSELIHDILTISKLESNNSHAEQTDFYFSEAIREAVSSLSPLAEQITVEINLDLDDILIRANKRQFYELCVNLIENAIKYNKPGGRVDISLKAETGNATLTITDTGIGIPPAYQARVFERFFRVDYGRDKKAGGTGLGLAIVKHIVGIYGGKISLQSERDKGTTIVVSLPGKK